MKKLFPARVKLADKISYYHLLLFLASLPFDRFYSHIILISFTIHIIIQFKKTGTTPVSKGQIIVLQSVFLITVITTVYSINKPEAFNEWGKQITIFLFPLIFYFSSFDLKKYREPLLLGFSIVCTLTVIYLYLDALHTINFYKLSLSSLFSGAFINHNFSEPIDMHATFLSMQLTLALVYLLAVILKGKWVNIKLFYAICTVVLLMGIIQLSSKSVFFCLFIIINVAIPWFLFKGKSRRNYILIAATLSLLLITVLFKSGTFRERYVDELKTDLSDASLNAPVESRMVRWAAIGGLIKKAPVIGYGAGSEVSLLQNTFFDKKYYNSFLHKLNAHSQYLSFLIKSGIIGLLLYLATLTLGFMASLKKKDLLFFTFLLLVALVSISENVLDVDKGIIFYAFFFSFFTYSVVPNADKQVLKTDEII